MASSLRIIKAVGYDSCYQMNCVHECSPSYTVSAMFVGTIGTVDSHLFCRKFVQTMYTVLFVASESEL